MPPDHSTVPGAEEAIPAGHILIWTREGVEGYLLKRQP